MFQSSLKPYLSLTLASSLVLASCGTPNTSATFGGIGQNPCLDNNWKSTDYCAGKSSINQSSVNFVASHQLMLEPIPLTLQRSGLPIALVANALTRNPLPAGAQVEFFIDGRSIGKIDPQNINSNTNTFFNFLQTLAPGQYQATGKLLSPTGEVLAESNVITFSVPEAVDLTKPVVALLSPTTQQPLTSGVSPSTFTAVAVANIPQGLPGTTLSFEFNGQTYPGTLQADGSYHFDIDTEGLAAGTYPVNAILKNAQGEIIARSNLKNIIIAPAAEVSAPQLKLFNLSGMNTVSQGTPLALSGQVTLPSPGTGRKIVFYANGQKIAEAPVDANGHYALNWQTLPFAPGTYQLTAKVLNANGSTLIESNTLPITITGADVAQPGVQLSSLPTQAFPGATIPLKASLTLPSGLPQEGLQVTFTANGEVVGTGTRNPDGTYSINWNTAAKPQGIYTLQATLKDASGQTLAISNLGKVELTQDSPVSIDLTSGNVSTVPGTRVTLSALAQISPELLNAGAYVEYQQGTRNLGKATRQPDGSYILNFDTTGYSAGQYPVQALLKSASGQQLALSNSATITLAAVPQNQIILTSLRIDSSVGSTVPLTANVTLAQTTINTQGASVQFMSNGELLGVGIKQPDGSYRLDWNTNGRNIGQYPIKAVLIDTNNQALAESVVGVVNLQSANSTSIVLSTPINGSTYAFGSNIPLQANIAATPAQIAAGVVVEFVVNNQVKATGVDAGSGKYSATLNQPVTGEYTVRAVLKTTGGSVLAESSVHTTRVENAASSGGGGSSSGGSGGGNGSIGTVNPPASVTPAVDLTRPGDGSGLSLDAPTELQANATLNPTDVANGYRIRFRDPASSFSQEVVPTRANTTTTSYSASVVYTPTGATGSRSLIAEVVNNGSVVSTLSDTHTVTVVDATVNLLSPLDNSTVNPSSQNTLSGTATNVPPGGSVRFVVRDSVGNTLATLPASNTGGDNYASATNAWIAPASLQDVDIVMQVLPPGTENPLISDIHDIAVVSNAIDTAQPANNTRVIPGASNANTLLQSTVPTLTPEQVIAGATVFFDVLDNNGDPIGLSNLIGTQQNDDTWQATVDLSGLAVGDYQVRAKLLASSDSNSSVLASDATPNNLEVSNPTVNMLSPANNSLVAPNGDYTLSGEATGVPTNGTVRFVVRDAGNNILATLAATPGSGNTWSSDVDAWTAPGSSQNVTIDMQVLAPGGTTPLVNDTHTVIIPAITLDQPVNNSSLVLGSAASVALSSTVSSNTPANSNVRFVVTNTLGDEVLNIAATAGANQTYTGSWPIPIATTALGEYTVTTVLQDTQNTEVVSDSHNLKITQNVATLLDLPNNIGNPSAGTLQFKDINNVNFSYIPRDSNGDVLTPTQMANATVQFVDTTNDAVLATGTRQGDGSYTVSLSLSVQPSGERDVVARIVDATNMAPLEQSPLKKLLLENFSDVLYGVDNANTKELYVINKNTGSLFLLGNMIDGGNALGKYPNVGAEKGFAEYIEGSGGNDLRKWDPATGTITELDITTTTGNYARFGFGVVNGQVVAFASNAGNVYRLNLTTGERTEIYRAGTTNTRLLSSTSNSGDLAFTPDGTLYIAQEQNVLRIAFEGATNAINATHASVAVTLDLNSVMQSNFSSFGFTGAGEALGVENRGSTNNQLIRLTGNFATATQGSDLTYATVGSAYGFVVGDITSSH